MTPVIKKALSLGTVCASIVFFGLGMYYPILSTHTQLLFKFGYEEINIFDSVALFFEGGEYFLGAIILTFTFIVPSISYVMMLAKILIHAQLKFSQNLDKWNMLDVFIIALLLLNFKLQSSIMVMELKIGTTFIALSVIFRIITMLLISSYTKQENN